MNKNFLKKGLKLMPIMFFLTTLVFLLTGCFMGAGTHGSIKSYTFNCKKDTLQKAVMKIIKNSPNIQRDTTLDYLGSSPLLDSNNCVNCKAGANFYNDIKHYVTIKITSEQEINEYIFRYAGSDESWDTLNSSQIFICYAHDKNGKGGSEGNGMLSRNQIKEFTKIFENEFVDKLDKELNLKRIEE